jgi:hypothetical protein
MRILHPRRHELKSRCKALLIIQISELCPRTHKLEIIVDFFSFFKASAVLRRPPILLLLRFFIAQVSHTGSSSSRPCLKCYSLFLEGTGSPDRLLVT